MTVLNFPASPAVNDTYTENGVTYTWNGNYWQANSGTPLDDKYVEIAGDVMTGNLQLPGGGGNTAALQKQEIDALITAADVTNNLWEKTAGTLNPKVNTDSVDIGDGEIVLNAADGSITTTGDVTAAGSAEFAGDTQSTSQNGGQLAGFRNQIINGDFRVWQRGTTVVVNNTVATYGADRWKANAGTRDFRRSDKAVSDSNAPIGFAYSGLILTNTSDNVVAQAIELDGPDDARQFYVGSTWTVSAWIKGATAPIVQCRFRDGNTSISGSNTLLDSSTPALAVIEGPDANGWSKYAATLTVDGSPGGGTNPDNCVDVQFNFQTPDTVRITGVQFEPGPVATPFEHRPAGTELALCQRYYKTKSIGGIVFNGNSGATTAFISLGGGTEMRVNPTVTNKDGTSNIYWSDSRFVGSDSGATAAAITSTSGGVQRIAIARLGSASTFAPRVICGTESNVGLLIFDAEL